MHAAVTTTLQRHKRYTLRRPASFLRSRSRGEIQELKTRWRERRERARERERAGEERERELTIVDTRRERERAADSEGAESRLRKMTAPRLLSVCPVGRPVLAGRESVRQEARRKRARGRGRARERGAGGVWRGSDRRVRLRDFLLSKWRK